MNLLPAGGSADYVVTGRGQEGHQEAQHAPPGRLGAPPDHRGRRLHHLPAMPAGISRPERRPTSILHQRDHPRRRDCSSPTAADGTCRWSPTHVVAHPVAPIDVSKYGLIYAGAQKNIGPAGEPIVIVREDLLGKAWKTIPSVMDYAVMAENGSMLNTPPTYGIYIAGLVFQWLKRQGGLAGGKDQQSRKAELLYNCIDASEGFYENPVRALPTARA